MNAIVVFWIFCLIGWVANVIQIVLNIPATLGEFTPIMIFKIIGVFAGPLGVIMGWIGFF